MEAVLHVADARAEAECAQDAPAGVLKQAGVIVDDDLYARQPSAVSRSTRGGGSSLWFAGRASVIIRIFCLPFFHTKKAPTNSTGSVVKRSIPIECSLLMKRTNSRLLFVNAGSK